MKKQKGFTLIELLAVIVILAIIALIATPMIMDVIDKAKKGSAESSMNGYVDAIEKYSVLGQMDNVTTGSVSAGVYDVKEATGENANFLKNVDVKGEKPTEGWVAINNKGYVEAAALKFNSYSGAPIVYVTGGVGKAATKNADTILTKPVADTTSTPNKTDVEVAKANAKAAIGE